MYNKSRSSNNDISNNNEAEHIIDNKKHTCDHNKTNFECDNNDNTKKN